MSNIIEFPTMKARSHSNLDRLVAEHDVPAIVMVSLGDEPADVKARARRWLAEVLNVTVTDAPFKVIAKPA